VLLLTQTTHPLPLALVLLLTLPLVDASTQMEELSAIVVSPSSLSRQQDLFVPTTSNKRDALARMLTLPNLPQGPSLNWSTGPIWPSLAEELGSMVISASIAPQPRLPLGLMPSLAIAQLTPSVSIKPRQETVAGQAPLP